MSKIVLYKNWIRKQSTEIVLKVCILLHKNTTMHFISKQILHVHVIALNCSFTSFLTLKLRVYIHMSRWMGAKEISWKVSHDAVLMFCCFDQAYTKWGYSCNPHTRSWGMPLVQPASSVGQTEKKEINKILKIDAATLQISAFIYTKQPHLLSTVPHKLHS